MHSCRVMLDSGSESSFITEQMFNKLNLCTTSTNISVSGICLVTSKVALDTSGLKIPPNVILADPSIDQPNSIDILIGIDKFWDLLSTGQIKLVSCNPNTSETLDVTLTKFWELEEKFLSRPLSIEDQRCEESFLKTTTQRPDGHFVVQLPFRHSESYLGHSKKIAIKRFLNLERKLNRNPLLKSDYSKFLEEYEALGHMIRTNFETLQNKPTFFLPHHGVINNTSETTKLRVVFDGSSKSSTGYSLNDILMVGPTVQQDLFSIVLRARKHEIMLTGDIAKMYRQVYVHETQWNLQVILWRPNPSEDLRASKGKAKFLQRKAASTFEKAERHPYDELRRAVDYAPVDDALRKKRPRHQKDQQGSRQSCKVL
uniref:Peptidase aspartic putative domain-containing protein n=1 Tax=Dendroctonus ponderosae TaxID=77166 RepID=A0AAR5PXZ3_DENPD